jgi:flagellin-specific chaperone FliS
MMEYLITQRQLRHLINESEGDNIQNDLKKLYQFTLDVIEKSQN